MSFFFPEKFFNVSLQHKNTTNSRNWSVLSTLIFPDAVIFQGFNLFKCCLPLLFYSPNMFFTWISVWIHTWYIWWYRYRITTRINWSNYIFLLEFDSNYQVLQYFLFYQLSLAAFSASSCTSLSRCIFKWVELFKVGSSGFFCSWFLENISLGASNLSESVLHH